MMKTNTTNKKAYQAPVIRSVEFNVEKGFAGSPNVPLTNSLENIGRYRSYSNTSGANNSDFFSYSFSSNDPIQ